MNRFLSNNTPPTLAGLPQSFWGKMGVLNANSSVNADYVSSIVFKANGTADHVYAFSKGVDESLSSLPRRGQESLSRLETYSLGLSSSDYQSNSLPYFDARSKAYIKPLKASKAGPRLIASDTTFANVPVSKIELLTEYTTSGRFGLLGSQASDSNKLKKSDFNSFVYKTLTTKNQKPAIGFRVYFDGLTSLSFLRIKKMGGDYKLLAMFGKGHSFTQNTSTLDVEWSSDLQTTEEDMYMLLTGDFLFSSIDIVLQVESCNWTEALPTSEISQIQESVRDLIEYSEVRSPELLGYLWEVAFDSFAFTKPGLSEVSYYKKTFTGNYKTMSLSATFVRNAYAYAEVKNGDYSVCNVPVPIVFTDDYVGDLVSLTRRGPYLYGTLAWLPATVADRMYCVYDVLDYPYTVEFSLDDGITWKIAHYDLSADLVSDSDYKSSKVLLRIRTDSSVESISIYYRLLRTEFSPGISIDENGKLDFPESTSIDVYVILKEGESYVADPQVRFENG